MTQSQDLAYSLIRFFRNTTSLFLGPQAQLTLLILPLSDLQVWFALTSPMSPHISQIAY